MAFARLQTSFARVFYQRCFYLFASLVVLLAAGPFVTTSLEGRMILAAIHVFILVAAVAAVGRSTLPFVIALLLGLPALGFRLMAGFGLDEVANGMTISSGYRSRKQTIRISLSRVMFKILNWMNSFM